MADDKKDKPAQTTATSTTAEHEANAVFVDDIIIWSEVLRAPDALVDGTALPRKLTHKALVELPPVDRVLLPEINSLIQRGVTIAAVPTSSGIGANCYLVNLATLKIPDDKADDES